MVTVYTKTAEGQREIKTRARRLTPRARSVLILIDGKRAHDELAGLVQQLDETLPGLIEAGLVEVSSTEPSARAPSAKAASAPAPTEDFRALRRRAVRAVNDLLGPSGELLAIRIERAADPAELQASLERAVAYIANARGGGAAAQFASQFVKPPAP